MYFLINILGIFIVMSVIYFCSPRKKSVKWRPILSLFIVELLVTWFMLGTKIGGWAINLIASFFSWLIACASDGIAFAFPSVMGNETVDFFFSALLPIIFVVTFFDILAYFGILTWMIDKIGWVISKVSRLPKLESFFSIQMMFLGNTEALAVIRGQLAVLKDNRLLTFGIMSMSSISGSILGSYLTMVPATYVFTAIPLNCLNALILASILNPVEVTKDEDIIYVPPKEEKKGLFLNDFKQHDGRNEHGHRHSRHGHRICRFNLMFERNVGVDHGRFDDSKNLFLHLQSVRIPAWTGAG